MIETAMFRFPDDCPPGGGRALPPARPHLNSPAPAPTPQPAPGRGGRFEAFLAWLQLAMATYVERRALRRVSDVLLKDIGLSRADVERESGRRFWDVPERRGR